MLARTRLLIQSLMQSKYYFSGVVGPREIRVLAGEKAAGMVNALQAAKNSLIEAYKTYAQVPLSLDSGSFQGNRDLEGYAGLIRHIGERFEWIASLDVIGNPAASAENYRRLQKLLPADLATKLVWVYQGGDLEELRRIAAQTGFIGIGGLVPMIVRSGVATLSYLEEVGGVIEDEGATAHLFGVGKASVLLQVAGERWFRSADASSWLCGFRSRELIGSQCKGNVRLVYRYFCA